MCFECFEMRLPIKKNFRLALIFLVLTLAFLLLVTFISLLQHEATCSQQNFKLQTTQKHFQKNAYVTMVSSSSFIPGALILMESLRETQTTADLVVMVLPHIPHESRAMLCNAGLIVKVIDYIENPNPTGARVARRQTFNYSKLNAWLLDYNRVVFMDADLLVIQNMDEVFNFPGELLAVENYDSPLSRAQNNVGEQNLFNSGLMVFSPSPETFKKLIKAMTVLFSYNGGDQGFLNQFYTNWTSLPLIYNVNKMIYKYDPEKFPPFDQVKAIHFIRKKPWAPKEEQIERRGNFTNFPEDFEELNDLWELVEKIYLKRIKGQEFNPMEDSIAKCISDSRQSYRRVIPKYSPPTPSPSRKNFVLDVYPNIRQSSIEFSEARDITLVTQMTVKTMKSLPFIVNNWTGPVCVIIYSDKFEIDTVKVHRFWKSNQQAFRHTSFHLVYKVGSNPPIPDLDVPSNFLRNIGLKLSQTDLVFMLDSNLIPSPGMYERLTKYPKFDLIQKYAPLFHCFVVPVFELGRGSGCKKILGDSDDCFQNVPSSKDSLRKLVDSKVITFHEAPTLEQYSTNTPRWFNESSPYYTHWTKSYRPAIIMHKNLPGPPTFNERFYEMAHSNVIFGFELYIKGYLFAVLPDVFLINGISKKIKRKTVILNQGVEEIEIKEKLRVEHQCPKDKITCGQYQTMPDILPLVELL